MARFRLVRVPERGPVGPWLGHTLKSKNHLQPGAGRGKSDKQMMTGSPLAPVLLPGICEVLSPDPNNAVTKYDSNLIHPWALPLPLAPWAINPAAFLPPPISLLCQLQDYCIMCSSTKVGLYFHAVPTPHPAFLECSPRLPPLFQELGTKFLMTKSVLGTQPLCERGDRSLIIGH